MKKKNYYPIIIIIILIFLAVLCFVFSRNNTNNSHQSENLNTYNSTVNIISDEEVQNKINEKASEPIEKELSSFTTNLSFSSEGRLTNIELTSKKLNGTTVEPGKEFSFNDTTRPIP